MPFWLTATRHGAHAGVFKGRSSWESLDRWLVDLTTCANGNVFTANEALWGGLIQRIGYQEIFFGMVAVQRWWDRPSVQ